MIRLVYSNRIEELLADLAARVRAQQEREGPLIPVRIVVHSAVVAQYLHLEIARLGAIAANLQTTLLTRFASETLGQLVEGRAADAAAFEAMALALLLDEAFLEDAELAPVRTYLAGGKSRESADIRRVQLAARVGHLFEQYSYSRSEMIDGWSRTPTLGQGPAETERWQRRMWLAMFGDRGLGRSRGLVPIHEALAALPADALDLGRPVHVFALSHFARAFHELFARISRGSDVFFYSLSPCEGFWEDFDPQDPLPLQLWARPGREHVRSLNAIAGFDHEDRFTEPLAKSLLAQMQRDLMHRERRNETADAGFAFDDDESILVFEHASVRRELEAVASEIWHLLERDETLRFDDITVLVPDGDAQEYLAHLTAIFREAHDIPLRRVDLPGTGQGRVSEAVELLLGLPLGRFTRQEVLRLARHPAVVASLDGIDTGSWLKWCDALGVVHGADRADHEGTYIERDILNWDQGLRRLALGAFMVGDASGERTPFESSGEAYVPHEVTSSESRDAAALGLLVRSLTADARFIQGAELSLKDWAILLCAVVEAYVAPVEDGDPEDLAHCLRSLHALGEVDLGGRLVRCHVALELARGRVAAQERGRGVEGVVVSGIKSARPMPFRIVFVCGMGEGKFPSADAEDPLDLRWPGRREGDVTARERDKYAFLEVLLGTRDRLYLSHVSRDPLTGDALAPSSVVQELLQAIARGYGRTSAALTRRHPLRRWDPCYFPDLFAPDSHRAADLGTMRFDEARAEAQVLALRQSARASGTIVDRDFIETRAASHRDWAALAEHLRLVSLPEAAPPAEGRMYMSMNALVKFLEFPLQGWARFRLGLDEVDDRDALMREDEPFETNFREETLLLRAIFFAATKKGSLERAYDDVARERELRGLGPTGVFAQGERTKHLAMLETWKSGLDQHSVSQDTIAVHRFGRGGEHASAEYAHPSLILDVDVTDAKGVTRIVRVEVGGRTLPLGRAGAPGSSGEAEQGKDAASGVSVTLSRRAKEGREEWTRADGQRAVLRAFVDHAVFSASGVSEGQPRGSLAVVVTPDGPQVERIPFAPISRSEATLWLRGLARDLLTGSHAYFLPSEAVLVWREKGRDGSLVRWLEAARDLMGDGDGPPALRSAYGAVPRPQRYPVPDEALARAMVAGRFGALFDKWEAP